MFINSTLFFFLYIDINNIMAKVQLSNVVVLDNPSPFLNPFQFELTFECIEDLNEGNFLKKKMYHFIFQYFF